jgi:hypothetical protein
MSTINVLECSLCNTKGPTLTEPLGFTTLKIGDEPELCICEDCVTRLEDVINKLMEQ